MVNLSTIDWWDLMSRLARPIVKLVDPNEWQVRRLRRRIQAINALESEVQKWRDEDFPRKTQEFRAQLQAYTADLRAEYEAKLREYRACKEPEERFRLEEEVAKLDLAVKRKEQEFLNRILPMAFAMVREAGRRTIKMRHFDVQLMGGIVLHEGKIAEMKTGEGKTLVATLPAYLNALTGRGVHIVTVNDYLAKRDAEWMGPIYEYLGLTVGYIQHFMESAERKAMYACDVTYVTNSELGFDYLRDNLAHSLDEVVLREMFYAIVDEVDSILIDEARTPHIIGGMVEKPTDIIERADQIVRQLRKEADFTVDEKHRTVALTDEGVRRVEQLWGLSNLSAPENFAIYHAIQNALKAHQLFKRDVHYVVKDGEVIIVDEFTGRLQWGRRWSDGLHQAVEAKEGIPIKQELQTVATITLQNFFRMYFKLAGMTGTAKTEEQEFIKIYGMPVVVIPTHKPMIRKDYPDVVFKVQEAKYRGVVREILQLYAIQRPVLVGTRSIEVNELISERLSPYYLQALALCTLVLDKAWAMHNRKQLSAEELEQIRQVVNTRLEELDIGRVRTIARKLGLDPDPLHPDNLKRFAELIQIPPEHWETALPRLEGALREGVPHNVLNAKHHEREAQIIAEAGRLGKVTVATNMAGRGVDIILGGKPDPENAPDELCDDPNCTVEFVHNKEYHPVKALGGLHILGTERHEARRIDNQLRGRSGRQGDPGSSRFYVALDDELWRLYGDKGLSEHKWLRSWPEEEPIAHPIISKSIEIAQKRVEGHNFEIRRQVLRYDDVMNIQREQIYASRRRILEGADMRANILDFVRKTLENYAEIYLPTTLSPDEWDYEGFLNTLSAFLPVALFYRPDDLRGMRRDEIIERLYETCVRYYEEKEARLAEQFGSDEFLRDFERRVLLWAIDQKWMEHLADMDYLREHIHLRAYGQQDPFVEYQREAYEMFQAMLQRIREETLRWVFFAEPAPAEAAQQVRVQVVSEVSAGDGDNASGDGVRTRRASKQRPVRSSRKVGPNDPCPCGSGKKYKKCCMLKEQQSGSRLS
jgi:preprotein translocase subunit SecA